MEPDKTPTGQPALSSRLYSYGMTAPKSLVARRPGSAPLDPLPGAERTGPSLRTRLPADAALSPSNALAASNPSNSLFGDTLASFAAAGGKPVGHSQPDPALSSGPLPFNQLARDRQRKAALIRDPPAGFVDPTDAAGPPVAAPPAEDAAERRRDPFWFLQTRARTQARARIRARARARAATRARARTLTLTLALALSRFIQMLRTELSDHEFAYMNVADSDGTTWDPYNLQVRGRVRVRARARARVRSPDPDPGPNTNPDPNPSPNPTPCTLQIVAFADVNPLDHYTIR